jgi:hypothetical protein
MKLPKRKKRWKNCCNYSAEAKTLFRPQNKMKVKRQPEFFRIPRYAILIPMRNFFQAGRLFRWVKNALFPGTLEFRAKIFTVLAVAGFLISVSTAIIGLANDAGAGNVIANCVAALLALALLAYSKRSGRYRLCYSITIAGVFIGLFPFMFFSAGGYHGGVPEKLSRTEKGTAGTA